VKGAAMKKAGIIIISFIMTNFYNYYFYYL